MDSTTNPGFAHRRTANFAVAEDGLQLRADNSSCSNSIVGCKSLFGMHSQDEPNVSGAVEHPACNQLSTSPAVRSDVCNTNAESNSNGFRALSREASASISSLGRQHRAVPEIGSISESGWTTYLNTPGDSWGVSLSMISRDRDILAELGREPSGANGYAEAACEDSSTASDASSGPEQPLFEHGPADDGVQEKCIGMATRSKRSKEAAFGGMGSEIMRRSKRGRLANRPGAGASTTSALEDTASSSLQMPVDDDFREMSDAGCDDKAGNLLVSPEWGSDAVKERLKVLETLVPRIKELAGKLSEEEMLKITVDYIRTLEYKVKMLDKLAVVGKSEDAATDAHNCDQRQAKNENASSCPLQDKGLWLMPISAVPHLQ